MGMVDTQEVGIGGGGWNGALRVGGGEGLLERRGEGVRFSGRCSLVSVRGVRVRRRRTRVQE